VYTLQDFNEQPNAPIRSSKCAQKYAEAYDTTRQPLRPAVLDGFEVLVSNQIPSYTQGTKSDVAIDLSAATSSSR